MQLKTAFANYLTEMKKLLVVFAIALVLGACQKREKFPVEPHIEFVSLEKIPNAAGYDQRATLTLHFQDGDGDIGLNESDIEPPFDTSSVYYFNFFIDYYKKVNGEFQKIDFEGVSFNQRIPRLSNSVPESIEGDIHLDLDINSYDFSTRKDTIKFRCRIVDRALHESNEVETDELIVKKW